MKKNIPDADGISTNELHRNIMRLAVVAFFIVAVGFVGNSFQGNSFTLNGHSSLAAVNVTVNGSTASISRTGGNIVVNGQNVANVTFNNGQLSGTVNGQNFSANLNDAQAKELGLESSQKADNAEAEKCLKGEGEQCRNKCSTSYVMIGSGGTHEAKDCYNQGEDPDKGADKALDDLAVCMAKVAHAGGASAATLVAEARRAQESLKQTLCITDAAKIQAKPSADDQTLVVTDSTNNATIQVPVACKAEYERIVKIRKGEIEAQTSAAAGDANSCAWKGAVVCYPTGTGDDAKWECKKKIEGASTATALVPTDPCAGKTGVDATLCKFKQGVDRSINDLQNQIARSTQAAQQAAQKAFGGQQQPQTPKPGGGSGGGSGSGSNNSKCPEGYKLSEEGGRTVCTKENSAATQPQCLLVASKEKVASGESVTLRWRTANAAKVDISGVGSGVPENSERAVTPTQTTEYKLTATAEGGGTKECSVQVVVDDTSTAGPSGSAPPQMACSPNTIPQDGTATVKWACTAAASSSAGEGLATGGKLGGEVQVSPDHNTEYTVECLKDGNVIGKNSCAVNVGKPIYDMVVHPTTAGRGDRVRVSWSSLFMKSCRVQGPRGFDYTRDQGVVITEPFNADDQQVPDRNIRAAIYSIECESLFGGKVTRDIEVKFSGN